jgi:ribonuclease HI
MTGNLFAESRRAGRWGGGAWYTAHCDGGSRGNPGPAGYGAVIEDPQGPGGGPAERVSGPPDQQLSPSTRACWRCWSGRRRMVRGGCAGGFGQRADGAADEGPLQGEEPGAQAAVGRGAAAGARLEGFEMRHTLRGGNKEADRLANEAMDKGREQVSGQKSSGGQGTRERGNKEAIGRR